ncbi:RagB/SusD family nutrient uptake outer membrane protein [Chitinophaga agrisoli]|nr:RagB/SusD family nutrient uptake outer membrane protein [Chitinophaga agrisoli]
MKYLLYPVLFSCLLLGSCGKGFFDQYPGDVLSNANFYTQSGDFEQGLNAAYANLRNNYRWWYVFGDMTSDDVYNWKRNNSSTIIQFNESNISSDNSLLNDLWNSSYATIARCNIVAGRIGNITMDETLKQRYTGEAKFLRALIYFNLVRVFGDVPLVLTEVTAAQQSFGFAREASDKVYAQIVQDLKDAAATLPDVYTKNNDIGRATSIAAKSLLGKVYLTRKQYPEAAAILQEVIGSGIPALLPTYTDVFSPDNPNNKEIIFAVQYGRGFDPQQGSPFGNDVAPNEPVNKIVVAAGNGQGTFLVTDDLAQAFTTADTRKQAIDSATGTRKYYFTNKYFDPAITKANDAANDWIVLRYADVLLMAAEAYNEQGQVTPALTYMNEVRHRAALTASATTDKGTLRTEIAQERRLELNCEGHRWFDLVRTGQAKTVMNAFFEKYKADDDQAGKSSTIQDNELIFPIPGFQVNLNPEKIKQNPGY